MVGGEGCGEVWHEHDFGVRVSGTCREHLECWTPSCLNFQWFGKIADVDFVEADDLEGSNTKTNPIHNGIRIRKTFYITRSNNNSLHPMTPEREQKT